MNKRYIAPVIMLIAGAVTSIINIAFKVEISESLKRLLVTLILFYIIGKIAAAVIGNVTNLPNGDSNKDTDENSSESPAEDFSSDDEEESER